MKIFIMGHSHIDAEWLWTLDETIRVCKETFSAMLDLMEKYPEFKFIQSSSLYYRLMEVSDPKLFERIKRFVKSGNWVPTGGTFVEFDANMPSGESLARHFLYGLRYFSKLRRPETLWLPDSFGFPPSLPMLIRKAGMRYFATQKLNWNDTNRFPYYLFRWRSPDGSEVLAINMPGTYGDKLTSIKPLTNAFIEILMRHGVDVSLVVFGRGDHGGGPSEEEVANGELIVRKSRGKVVFGGLDDFFREVERYRERLPEHSGELYLEYHRGVFTSGSWIKRLNRLNEALIVDVEKLYTLLSLFGVRYPKELIDSAWFVLMVNHFHDTMSASVSYDVYIRAIRRHMRVRALLRRLFERGLSELSKKLREGEYVLNLLPWERSGYLSFSEEGSSVYVERAPPLGVGSLKVSEPEDGVSVREAEKFIVLENGLLRVVVSRATGRVVSIYRKDIGFEAIRKPITLRVLHDYPVPIRRGAHSFDAWEVYYLDGLNRGRFEDMTKPVRVEVKEGEGFATVYVEYRYKQFGRKESRLALKYRLRAGEPYLIIDFRAEWRAWHRMVKLLVEPNVSSRTARFEAPYGVVERIDCSDPKADRFEKAKYEAPGQRWVDVSDGEKGLAIINDSKYGYSWRKGVIGVSLLRSATLAPKAMMGLERHSILPENPLMVLNVLRSAAYSVKRMLRDPVGWLLDAVNTALMEFGGKAAMDQGKHEATLVIYPHRGSYDEAGVPRIAEELLHPLVLLKGEGGDISSLSLAEVEGGEAVIGCFKPAEDGDGVVMRLFNPSGRKKAVTIRFPNAEFDEVAEVDIPETGEITREGIRKEGRRGVSVEVDPCEVRTLKLSGFRLSL